MDAVKMQALVAAEMIPEKILVKWFSAEKEELDEQSKQFGGK